MDFIPTIFEYKQEDRSAKAKRRYTDFLLTTVFWALMAGYVALTGMSVFNSNAYA